MKFCEDHWSRLRAALDQRGLTPFIAKDGTTAVIQLQKSLAHGGGGGDAKDTFDPLMAAHWAIVNNTWRVLADAGTSPLYLLMNGPEDLVDVERAGAAHAGRTWPRCPLCYINLAHELTCTEPACRLPKVNGYDWMLDRAADDALELARGYGLVAPSRRGTEN